MGYWGGIKGRGWQEGCVSILTPFWHKSRWFGFKFICLWSESDRDGDSDMSSRWGGRGWGERWLLQLFNSILIQTGGIGGKIFWPKNGGICEKKPILTQIWGILDKVHRVWKGLGWIWGSGGQNKPQEVSMGWKKAFWGNKRHLGVIWGFWRHLRAHMDFSDKIAIFSDLGCFSQWWHRMGSGGSSFPSVVSKTPVFHTKSPDFLDFVFISRLFSTENEILNPWAFFAQKFPSSLILHFLQETLSCRFINFNQKNPL